MNRWFCQILSCGRYSYPCSRSKLRASVRTVYYGLSSGRYHLRYAHSVS